MTHWVTPITASPRGRDVWKRLVPPQLRPFLFHQPSCSNQASQTLTTISSVRISLFVLRSLLTVIAAKTTDENLTGENWELILNLCDKVQDEGDQGYVAMSNTASLILTLFQSSECHRRYLEALDASDIQCSALHAHACRVSHQELRNRSASRDFISRIYSGTRETHYRQGECNNVASFATVRPSPLHRIHMRKCAAERSNSSQSGRGISRRTRLWE